MQQMRPVIGETDGLLKLNKQKPLLQCVNCYGVWTCFIPVRMKIIGSLHSIRVQKELLVKRGKERVLQAAEKTILASNLRKRRNDEITKSQLSRTGRTKVY